MKIEENDVCRLCAKPFTSDISARLLDDNICVKIYEILRIRTIPDETFNHICLRCHENVDHFHTFYREVQDAQGFFNDKSFVIPEIKIEDTSDVFEEVIMRPNDLKLLPETCELDEEKVKTSPDDPDFDANDEGSSPEEDEEVSSDESESEEEERMKEDASQRKKRKQNKLINEFFEFVCQKCKVRLRSWTKFRKHMRKKHDEKRAKIFCCNNSLEVAHAPLLGHYYFHTNPERLKCVACDKQYNNLKSLAQHTRKVHKNPQEKKEEPKVFCPECGIPLVKRCLQNHLKIHQPRVKLQCDICQKFLQSRKAMLYHMTQQHLPKNPNVDQILCNICAKSFVSKDRFNHHLRYHHNDATGECPDCHVVMRLENLRVHRKRVHEIKKVSCPICFKEFKNSDRLRGHKIKVHVEPRFQCDICNKKYKTKDKMQEHRSTHFDELRFKCDLCDHMNNDYGNMTKHRKTKHRDVPYPAPGTARKIFEISRH